MIYSNHVHIHILLISFLFSVLLEYCEDETFEPQCEQNEVIMMVSARYGRMRIAECLTTNYGMLGCTADIMYVLDRLCSGRRRCSVPVRDLMVSGDTKPCSKDLRSYLEAQYTCVPTGKTWVS